MNRFLLALRCFLAVLLYYRLPKDALALVPPPAPAPPQLEEGAPVEAGAEAAVEAGAEAAVEAGAEAAVEAGAEAAVEVPAAPSAEELRHRGAVQVLALLQREGRLVDFLMEEVAGYTDAQIGAAARDIHRGCRKALLEHLEVVPIRPEPDEAAVRIDEGYDPSAVRLIGNIQGKPPFHGTLRHHGWRVQRVRLPDLPPSHDPLVIAPAEVELGG